MKFCLSVLFLLCYGLSFAQMPLSVKAFLATSRQENTLEHQQKIADFLSNTSHQMPWVEEVEVRSRTHDFDLAQQEYIFRVTPNSPRQRWAQKKYHNSTLRTVETEKQVLLEEALLDRYEIVAGIYFCNRLLEAKKGFILLFQDRINTLQKTGAYTNFDISDLLRTEDDLYDLEMEILQLEHTCSGLQSLVASMAQRNDSLQIDKENFIKVEDIQNILPQLQGFSMEQHPLLVLQKAKIDMLAQEFNVEDAERRNVLDFVESRFEGQQDDLFRERFSVGISLKLPFRGSAKLKLNELKLDQLEAENKKASIVDELNLEREEYMTEMNHLLREHELLKQQLEKTKERFSNNQLIELSSATAYTLLRIKESIMEKELAIVKKEQKIFETYLELLHLSGVAAKEPLVNYLSSNLERF
jgi:hypothetical protein